MLDSWQQAGTRCRPSGNSSRCGWDFMGVSIVRNLCFGGSGADVPPHRKLVERTPASLRIADSDADCRPADSWTAKSRWGRPCRWEPPWRNGTALRTDATTHWTGGARAPSGPGTEQCGAVPTGFLVEPGAWPGPAARRAPPPTPPIPRPVTQSRHHSPRRIPPRMARREDQDLARRAGRAPIAQHRVGRRWRGRRRVVDDEDAVVPVARIRGHLLRSRVQRPVRLLNGSSSRGSRGGAGARAGDALLLPAGLVG